MLARFLDMLAMLLFLTFNRHIWLISLLADSFHTLPIGGGPLNANAFNALIKAGMLIFLNDISVTLNRFPASDKLGTGFGFVKPCYTSTLYFCGWLFNYLLGNFDHGVDDAAGRVLL